MPIGTEEPSASTACRDEAGRWMAVASVWDGSVHPEVWSDLPGEEAAVVGFHDPAADLTARAAAWGHRLEARHLGAVCRFGAGLALAEANAWEDDQPDIATRAAADRRFLLGDRLLHWAVPWLDGAGRCHPACRDDAHAARDTLLWLGDLHRPVPDLGFGAEGVYLEGEDSIGPLDAPSDLAGRVGSIWSGTVIFRATLESMTARQWASRRLVGSDLDELGADLAVLYDVAAARWRRVAVEHPGSARLWADLSARATRTALLLAG